MSLISIAKMPSGAVPPHRQAAPNCVHTAAQGLERCPLADVPLEPGALLDKTRYQLTRKVLPPARETALQGVLARLAAVAARRGVLVKPLFEDAARDPNSPRAVNHVTPAQFRQARRCGFLCVLFSS